MAGSGVDEGDGPTIPLGQRDAGFALLHAAEYAIEALSALVAGRRLGHPSVREPIELGRRVFAALAQQTEADAVRAASPATKPKGAKRRPRRSI